LGNAAKAAFLEPHRNQKGEDQGRKKKLVRRGGGDARCLFLGNGKAEGRLLEVPTGRLKAGDFVERVLSGGKRPGLPSLLKKGKVCRRSVLPL